jgi:EpsI family protein
MPPTTTRSVVLFVCLLAGSGFVAYAQRIEPVMMRASFDRFPMALDEWRGIQEPPFEDQILKILGVDDYLTRVYMSPTRAGVGLYIGYYRSQRQGDTMHSPLNCLPGAGWEPLSKGGLTVEVPSGTGTTRAINVNRYVVQKGLEKQLVIYWYQSHGRIVASEYWSRFYLVTDAVRLNRTDGSLVRVIAPVSQEDTGEKHAEDLAVRFIKSLFPVLSTYLPA